MRSDQWTRCDFCAASVRGPPHFSSRASAPMITRLRRSEQNPDEDLGRSTSHGFSGSHLSDSLAALASRLPPGRVATGSRGQQPHDSIRGPGAMITRPQNEGAAPPSGPTSSSRDLDTPARPPETNSGHHWASPSRPGPALRTRCVAAAKRKRAPAAPSKSVRVETAARRL